MSWRVPHRICNGPTYSLNLNVKASSCRWRQLRKGTLTMLKSEEISLLLRALRFAAAKHRDQRRKDREASPYINHPIEVASVLAMVGGVQDAITLAAAALHDTIEDTRTTAEELEVRFGREVRTLVEE